MLHYLFLSFLGFTVYGSDLGRNKKCNDASNLYDRGVNKYISDYHKALFSYKNESCENCSCYENVIKSDLLPFEAGISEDMLRDCSSNRGVKFQIISGKWYRSKQCLFPSRCEGVEYFLNSIKNELPDMELCINFHDWPQIDKHYKTPVPIFSFSKTQGYYDIMYPAWSFWKGGPAIKLIPEGLGRWDLGRKSMQKASEKWPWEKKDKKYFFRGSRTSNERDTLILLSRENPHIADAAYTKNQAWKSEKDTLGFPPSSEISLEDHCQYKYLFNFRGVTASFRLKYLFLCQSLVIHVGDEWKEFFYSALQPWVHYVPLNKNATILEYRYLFKFLSNADEISRSIASRGYEFIEKYLNVGDVRCYWKKLLLSYSKLLKFKPKKDSTLIPFLD